MHLVVPIFSLILPKYEYLMNMQISSMNYDINVLFCHHLLPSSFEIAISSVHLGVPFLEWSKFQTKMY